MPPERYRLPDRLDAEAVLITVERLEERIQARFPERGLRRVAAELRLAVLDGIEREDAGWATRALTLLSRCAAVALAAMVATVLVILTRELSNETDNLGPLDALYAIETGVNDVIFAAVAVAFLWYVPSRLKRNSALHDLYRLRSIAHVIDMHQLTKDPERLSADFKPTNKTVRESMTASEMANYLDYCSELLSLVGKAAALFGQRTTNQSVLSTISDIEGLTGSMSNKIWQKVALLPVDSTSRHRKGTTD